MGGGDHDGAAAGGRSGRGGPGARAAVAAGTGQGSPVGTGVDGLVVVVPVRRAGGRAAGGADGAAARGRPGTASAQQQQFLTEVAGDDAHPARHPVKDLEELNGLLGAWLRIVYHTRQKLAIAIFEWIEAWYSPARRYSALGWDSPVTHERVHDTLTTGDMIITTHPAGNLASGFREGLPPAGCFT